MLVDRGIKVVDNKYIWRNDPRLVNNSIYRLSEAQVSAFLESIKVPTLLIEPTDGWPGYNSPPYEHRKKLIDNLTVEVIEGHHHVHMDKADTIKKIILSYMTKIGQR
jgi:pimeloyl-ACP methyl ester carboxylesterase